MYQEQPHGFNLFFNDLNTDNLKNVILLYGRERFLFRWVFDTLSDKYVNPAMRTLDRVVVDEEELENLGLVDTLLEACETPPMLSDRKIVWVREPAFLQKEGKALPAEDKARLANYLENPEEGCILIFSSTTLDIKSKALEPFVSKTKTYNMDKLDKKSLRQFISKRFRAAGIMVNGRDVDLLIDESGYYNKESDYDLYSMENDLQKLVALTEGGSIPSGAIQALVSGDEETYLFDLIESISTRKKERAFEILNNKLTQGEEIYGQLSQLAVQFELMLSIRQMRDDGIPSKEMAKRLGANPYRVEKLMPQAARFSKDELMKILSSVYEIDREIKTGYLDQRLALELFIANL